MCHIMHIRAYVVPCFFMLNYDVLKSTQPSAVFGIKWGFSLVLWVISPAACSMDQKLKSNTISHNTAQMFVNNSRSSNSNSIPEDLLIQILIRLPVKTLLRCRCVCKSWYPLISNPTFITSHINHNFFHTPSHVIIQRWNERTMKFRFTLHKDNETLDWITELDLPIPVPNQFYKILDCIAGLVCLLDDCKTKHNLLLWNPLIKEVLILPNPTIENDLVESSCFGFGFDPLNCEYKVVRITYVGVGSWTEVFRVKTQSWVRIDVSCSESLPSIISKQAYVNGHVNWVCSNHMILVFEVRNEVFKEMVLPKALDKVDVHGQTIAVWKGFLSVFAVENFKVCLWVMREYGVEESWTKQCVLEPYTIYRQVQGIRTNGCIIFEDLYSNLTCLDPETQLIEHLALCVQGTLSAFHIKPYAESLALLDLK